MSAQKVSQTLLVASLVMLAIGLVVLFMPQAASAQCEDPNAVLLYVPCDGASCTQIRASGTRFTHAKNAAAPVMAAMIERMTKMRHTPA